MMKRKCLHCKHRRECYLKVKRNRRRFTVMVSVALVIMLVGTICAIANVITKEKKEEEIEAIKTVEMKPQQEMSSYPAEEDLPEIKTISKEENEESKVTANQIVEVTDEVPLIFSEAERIAMGKTVYKEARGECEKGRIAIVAVILNRLITGKVEYGAENGNVMEVITYSGAFAYPKDMTDEFFLNCPEYELCMEAVEKALNGEDPTREYFPEGACHFYSLVEPLSEKEAARREGIDIYVIGNQAFHNDLK